MPFGEPQPEPLPRPILPKWCLSTGLEAFEPGQLKLVAVLSAGNKKIAMAEDYSGKGYRLYEGICIGQYGVVNIIESERVSVTETTMSRPGRIKKKETIMRLNKEGDK